MSWIDWMVASGWAQMCAAWAVLLWLQRRAVMLRSDEADDSADGPTVAVVVPACNEAESIGGCIAGVLSQTGVRLRVVVVDDRSEDDTARIVAGLAERDDRISLVRVTQLSTGWLGKSHALWTATRGLEAQWLVFLDADCRLLGPRSIRAAWREAQRSGADLLTLWPRHDAGSFAEAMLIPLCAAVMALWFGGSNRPGSAAFANGQFLMVRRAAYERVGGHGAVRDALIEDVPLAQAVRAAGYHTRAVGGRDVVAVRMYDSAAGVFRGWSRIFVGALRSPWKIALSVLWLVAGSLWPMAAGVLLGAAWMMPDDRASTALVVMTGLCAAHLLLMLAVSIGFWGMGRCDRRYLWLYPLSVVGVVVILAHAWWTLTVRRRVRWRTTDYHFDRRARIVGEA